MCIFYVINNTVCSPFSTFSESRLFLRRKVRLAAPLGPVSALAPRPQPRHPSRSPLQQSPCPLLCHHLLLSAGSSHHGQNSLSIYLIGKHLPFPPPAATSHLFFPFRVKPLQEWPADTSSSFSPPSSLKSSPLSPTERVCHRQSHSSYQSPRPLHTPGPSASLRLVCRLSGDTWHHRAPSLLPAVSRTPAFPGPFLSQGCSFLVSFTSSFPEKQKC